MLTDSTAAALPPVHAPSLFDQSPRCFACGDIGLEVSRDGGHSTCWRIRAGAPHNRPSKSAEMIARSLEHLKVRKLSVDQHAFQVAAQIAAGTSDSPVKRDRLIEGNFQYTRLSLRAFHSVIETLRSVWLLPIGSRKEDPAGYWIITDAEDFRTWFNRAKSAPITQLRTIHRVAKRNFPIFAEQIEIEFGAELGGAE